MSRAWAGLRAGMLICVCTLAAWPQQSATLSGTVIDASGSVVPSASITIQNIETGVTYNATSNASGNYVISFIKPGKYSLTAEAAGFKRYQQLDLALETAAQVRANATLELGQVSESITVEASAPLLKTENSSVGVVVQNKTIANMPLINRRAAQLARLSGFVVQNGNGSNFTMAGGRGDNSMWTIDGGNAQNILLGVATLTFDPPIEALEEFNVEVSNYKAELGRTGGGFVQMTTKSGTNRYHGALYEFMRNNALDARSFFSADKPVLRRHQFGFAFGGPIRKNKTFFFGSGEWTRQTSQQVLIQNLPSPAELQGDFSGLSATIRDPRTRQPVPGKIIPRSQIDPVAAELAKFYPAPNVAGAPTRNRNFQVNETLGRPAKTFVARIDHNFNDSNRIYGRFLHNSGYQTNGGFWPFPVHNNDQNIENLYHNWSITGVHNLRPTLVSEWRYTGNHRKYHPIINAKGSGLVERIGLRGVDPEFFPGIRFTGGIEGIGRTGGQERRQYPIRDMHLMNNYTILRGRHTIKWGVEFRASRNDDENLPTAGGSFNFNSNATGDALAAFLYGWVNSASRVQTLLLRSRANTVGSYIQTDWQVNNRLTLNLGLRYDLDWPRWETVDNRQNSFDRATINPACNCPGVVTWSGRNGLSRYASNFDKNNFGPRIGFAWRPADKWVIRGGGSVVYTGQYDQATPNVVNAGFSINGSFVSPDGGRTAAFLLRDGLPSIPVPSEKDLVPSFGAVAIGQPTVFAPQFFETNGRVVPYLLTGNFNVQRQLPGNMVAEIGYLTTIGHHLVNPGDMPINQVHPSLIPQMQAGVTPQLLRPFPQFSNVNVVQPTIGNSNYHGMNLRLEKRFSAGLQFNMNYTWSKAIDDVESRNELGGEAGATFTNVYDNRNNRALAGTHIGHRYIGAVVWDLPFGTGRRFHVHNGFLNQVVGGWNVSTILEMRSGSPFGAIYGNTAAIYPTAPKVRAKALGPYQDNPAWRDNVRGQTLFNTSTFVAPDRYTFGNVGRAIAIGPGAFIGDLSVNKRFFLPFEGHTLEFRSEFLNFPNHPNFGLPDQDVNSRTFGTVTSLQPGNAARIIQFGLRYAF